MSNACLLLRERNSHFISSLDETASSVGDGSATQASTGVDGRGLTPAGTTTQQIREPVVQLVNPTKDSMQTTHDAEEPASALDAAPTSAAVSPLPPSGSQSGIEIGAAPTHPNVDGSVNGLPSALGAAGQEGANGEKPVETSTVTPTIGAHSRSDMERDSTATTTHPSSTTDMQRVNSPVSSSHLGAAGSSQKTSTNSAINSNVTANISSNNPAHHSSVSDSRDPVLVGTVSPSSEHSNAPENASGADIPPERDNPPPQPNPFALDPDSGEEAYVTDAIKFLETAAAKREKEQPHLNLQELKEDVEDMVNAWAGLERRMGYPAPNVSCAVCIGRSVSY